MELAQNVAEMEPASSFHPHFLGSKLSDFGRKKSEPAGIGRTISVPFFGFYSQRKCPSMHLKLTPRTVAAIAA
jgi:hypothetical protein